MGSDRAHLVGVRKADRPCELRSEACLDPFHPVHGGSHDGCQCRGLWPGCWGDHWPVRGSGLTLSHAIAGAAALFFVSWSVLGFEGQVVHVQDGDTLTVLLKQ